MIKAFRERLLQRSSADTRRWVKGVALAGVLVFAALSALLGRGGRDGSATASSPPRVNSGLAPRNPVLTAAVKAAPLEVVDAGQVGLDPSRLDEAIAAVRREVDRGAFPGAVLAVGRGSQPVLMEGIGQTAWGDSWVDPVNTVYDLASLTKVVATTTAVMLLVEDGLIDLDAPVQRYLPEFSGDAKAIVTVRQLLTHTSGLPDWTDVEGLPADVAMLRILHIPLEDQPGEDMEYSDLGFVVLHAAAERAAGEPLDYLLQRRVFTPLGMAMTGFVPGAGCMVCAPTMIMAGQEVRGIVHDPIARTLGGIAGNAGLFASAPDLARFAGMLASGGEIDGVRILSEQTIAEFTKRQPGADSRALGWDTPSIDGSGGVGRKISPRAFGHTGYTGTSLWVDPDRHTWTILLTNRTFRPRAENRIQALRRALNDEVALSATADSAREADEE